MWPPDFTSISLVMTLVGFLARRPVLFAARTSGESSTCACGTALRVVAVVVVGLSCGSAAYSVSANAVRPQLRIAFILPPANGSMLRWRAEISCSAPNLAFWRVNVARAPATEVRLSRRLHRHLSGGRDHPGDGRLLRRARLPRNLHGDAGGL